ncbi:MAG: vitamin B12-dependent ribonucleotide reductase [Myxococcota bacterium]
MQAPDTTATPRASTPQSRGGLRIERRWTAPSQDVWSTIDWTQRTASITDGGGQAVFEQADIEAPSSWSQLAINVVASKYFRGHVGAPDRESSVRQLIGRVADTITDWGRADGYFDAPNDADAFRDELTFMLLHQHYAFNSPVWFNVGVESRPQCSACFINSVEDSMESIMELARTEARLFKGGSGAGTNLSRIRGSNEKLTGGGTASGPVSFMKGFDAFAGVIKSGGKTRRAAKMVILDCDHPDIETFINCKAEEEKKAWALIEMGYDGSFTGEAYGSVFFQNANHSIRTTDAFMRAAAEDGPWPLRGRADSDVAAERSARALLKAAAEAAHVCGDPGIQFDSTINLWHTCPNSDRIYASNPCSEYMFLDDSACNLGSLNLLKFVDDSGRFDAALFRHACTIATLAQEIVVDNASYPTDRIAQNSHRYRPLGLGYANLGALLMSLGMAYDSDPGRDMAAAITALMCGAAYATSAHVAQARGAFEGYSQNRKPFLGVMNMHRDHAYSLDEGRVPKTLLQAAREAWDDVVKTGETHGFRNAQVTVLAPTGTIAFMMDCDTTGIEPDIALIKYKRLVGGGMLKIVNRTVPLALTRLGYSTKQRAEMLEYIENEETIEGAPHLQDEHLPVFDCAFRAQKGTRSIEPMGHVKMMAAVQPFLSGAISKTVNVPEDATVDDIYDIYVQAWRLGLKAIAVYRDNSKRSQPLATNKDKQTGPQRHKTSEQGEEERKPWRRSLPAERAAITHKFAVGGHEGYITVGLYDDGTPGELFITMSKEGSTISGLMDTIATSISLALQYGVPVRVLVDRFSHMRFEPSGFTGNPNIPIAKSIVDYIFRWIGQKFLSSEDAVDSTMSTKAEKVVQAAIDGSQIPLPMSSQTEEIFRTQADAPPCPQCGSITVRAGACYACNNCGATSGCG